MGTSVARKALMALTGLFLCLFLVVHMLGNLQLFGPEEAARSRFNGYADMLAHLPVIQAAALVTYGSILAHTVLAVLIARRNRQSVGEGYSGPTPATLAQPASRFMGVLGVLILVFLVVHMADFWYPFKFGAELDVDGEGHRDLFALVVHELQTGWKVGLYVLGAVAVGVHLWHGVYSGLRSLGVSHPGYAKWLRRIGVGLAVVLTLGFGSMPIYLYLAH